MSDNVAVYSIAFYLFFNLNVLWKAGLDFTENWWNINSSKYIDDTTQVVGKSGNDYY